ncbi:DNA-formamidopyrimidine glycosylase [Thermoactinomyces sp. DSM 45892]|uniref:DNA-formamidopyrimidine glycosylase n=1 Tax=Thermoactinomyces sp. DSM 45892 TaxID=1882753 RepID=UPI000895A70A|nr:DNA-formamidopyrimidine glycosylase [Thermoactinomyces sp. DSM 45892]SDZ12647.1 DNA-(apurinic or apyrimidinic site) lyase [Thermoactinomyces sp. DSM 45892]
MPELPEVETVRKTLEQLVVGKTIQDVSVHLPRIIQRPDDIDIFSRELQGSTITGIGRRGKFLKIFCDPWVIVSHLRMEGKYRVADQGVDLEKHTHVIFHFTDGTELRYKDVRQFGTMHLFPKGEEEGHLPLKKLGPEPLDPDQYRLDWFESVIRRRKTKIKPLLLNQEVLVGLGNIYVDEALHSAKIHPERSANELTHEEIHLLYHSISETLSKAVEAGGSSVRSYVNGQGEMGMFQLQIQVYGRKNEPCYTCGSPIERLVVGGRGTHICPQCQK